MIATFRPSALFTSSTPIRLIHLILPVVCLTAMTMAPAAAATWSGAGADNNWSTIENWDGNAVPTADDAVTFPASMPRLSNVNDIGAFAFNSISIVDEYTITSTYAITTPTINVSTNATLAAPLVIPPAGLITITQTTDTMTLTLNQLISGTGGINLAGAGVIALTGAQANTYTGLTTVATTDNGFVRLARTAESIPSDLTITGTGEVKIEAGSSQIHYASLVTVLAGGVLNISLASGLDSGVDNETIGALTGSGEVILGDRKLGCFYAPLNSTYSGILVGSASSSLRKHGSYVQKLSGTSADFLGTTRLNGSSLTVLGTQTSSNISATAGTLLVGGLASVGSISMTGTSNLSVGNEAGVENQAFSKSLSMGSTSRMDVFSGSDDGPSTLTVVGTVALGGATLTVNTDDAPPTAGTDLLIIDNDGTDAVSGTFAGLSEGAELISSGATPVAFTISYIGGANANDVVLTALAAPTIASPAITSASTAAGTVDAVFSYQITTSPAATSYTATDLPTGLSINTATGEISGTPTIAQEKNVLLTASNASGTGSGTVTVTISGTGPGPGGGNPLPPGPTSSGSGSDGGCGSGATGLALVLLFGLALCPLGQRR